MRRKPPPKPQEIKTDVSALAVPTCPNCGASIDLQAAVEKFGEPRGWNFYGYEGERWLKCQGQSGIHSYRHFIVLINGRQYQRLAWIKPPATVAAVQENLL